MSIVSSSLTTEAAQKDGRFWVHETHTDNIGLVYLLAYLADVGTDTATILANRAIQLGNDIAAAEIASNLVMVTTLGSLAVPTFHYSTVPANVAALRAAYLVATQTQAIFGGDYLSTLTDVQLENAFGLTALQVATLRTNKLTPAAAAATTIRASTGA